LLVAKEITAHSPQIPSRHRACCPFLAVAICEVTGGMWFINAQLGNSQASMTKIDTFFIS
jgi:hypothetical protein